MVWVVGIRRMEVGIGILPGYVLSLQLGCVILHPSF